MQEDATVSLGIQQQETVRLVDLDLPERYSLEEVIGGGGMGVVIRAHDRELENKVAIKLLHENLQDPEQNQRFLREAKTLAQLDHPSIIQIKAFGISPSGKPYQVFEFLKGETLGERLQKGSLSAAEFKEIFLQVSEGLAYAKEQGVVHRDIKPSNIFLTRAPDGELTATILDFGIARVEGGVFGSGQSTLTSTTATIGSPLYMSPEQCRGQKVDYLSDVYSLGCVMYQSLTGKPPFEGETALDTMYQHNTAAPPVIETKSPAIAKLGEFINRCLAKQPSSRPQDYKELTTLLLTTLENADESLEAIVQRKRESYKDKAIAAVLALCLIGSGFLFLPKFFSKAVSNGEAHPIEKEIVTLQRILQTEEAKYHRAATKEAKTASADVIYANSRKVGQQLQTRERFDEAEVAFRKALEIAPETTYAPYNLATAYISLADLLTARGDSSRFAEAESLYNSGVAVYGDQQGYDVIHARARRGILHARMGKIGLARREDFDVNIGALRNRPVNRYEGFERSLIGDTKAAVAEGIVEELKQTALLRTPQDKLDLAHVYLLSTEYLLVVPDDKLRAKHALKYANELLQETANDNLPEWGSMKAQAIKYGKEIETKQREAKKGESPKLKEPFEAH